MSISLNHIARGKKPQGKKESFASEALFYLKSKFPCLEIYLSNRENKLKFSFRKHV